MHDIVCEVYQKVSFKWLTNGVRTSEWRISVKVTYNIIIIIIIYYNHPPPPSPTKTDQLVAQFLQHKQYTLNEQDSSDIMQKMINLKDSAI